jgi:hypothetical protein
MVSDGYYKFLDSGDVGKVLTDGTLAISSLAYYRSLEEKEWELIADRLEGASEMTTPGNFVLTEGSPELTMINNAGLPFGGKFARVESGGKIFAGGIRFLSVVPGHIFCASRGDFGELVAYNTQKAAREYDACLKIKSFEGVLSRVFETGVDVATDRKFNDLFDRCNIGPVIYESASRCVTEGPMIVATPFRKAPEFESQREVRIHFLPREGEAAPDRLIVKIADPKSLFEFVELN